MRLNPFPLPVIASVFFALASFAAPADPLESGFINPPDSAKPQTWWHWMNGNITKAGITADLEAMKQIGLGGATIVNVDCSIPRGPVTFMSPKWQADFKFAVQEANRLGLKLCVENCAGWSSSGGPWNTVTNAMQRLTSSETRTQGPAVFDAVLPRLPKTLGFYRDIAVLAFKAPTGAGTVSNAATSADKLKIKRAVYEAKNGGGSRNVTARILALIKSGQKSVVVGNDELGGDPAFGQVKQLQVEFTLNGKPGTLTVDEGNTLILPVNARQLAAARLLAKSSLEGTFVHPSPANDFVAGAIPQDEIEDLTAKLAADGRLKWNVPPGKWIIVRLGYTPIGVDNHPAPKEGTGLECDKLSKAALDLHWNGFMQKVLNDIGPLAGKTLNCSLIDSYEVGNQDWTKNFRADFEKRRGYDPLTFMPTFAHVIVDNPAVTKRFLWDMRRTIADLFAENYYGHFAKLCHRHGLMSAVEPYTGPFESLQCGASADIVMGEFWTGSQGNPSVKLAVSIAHIYGKTIVGAESFTTGEGRWQEYPYSLKLLGDRMFCEGLNRYIFHRYAMQPWTNRWPGMTMGQFGFAFERTETWWKQAKPWIKYITRCEFLLQQGRAVDDVAYFDGQSAPVEMRVGNPPLPAGYDYDAVDADVLLHGATVKDGRLTLASGANYAVLVLPPDDRNMTPPMLRRIRKLVRAGATVMGARPQHSPSLKDYPECDVQVRGLADELWGKCNGKTVLENSDGKGRIVWGKSLSEVLAEQHLKPDFKFHGASPTTDLAYTHRIARDADIYFVSNQRRRFDSAECTFRVSGKIPELWHPDTGVIERAPIWSEHDGRTTVQLNFDPAGSVFVIFRHPSQGEHHLIAVQWHGAEVSQKKPARLRIVKATYGPARGSDGRLDVTAKVEALMRNGTRQIPANNDLAGQDPAFGIVKHLRIEFRLNGELQTNEVEEGQTLQIPAGAQIVRAVYGDLHTRPASANKTIDLTQKLDDMAKAGGLDVGINNTFAGRDPAFGTPKALRVDYVLNGKPGQITVNEGATLVLPENRFIGEPPQWQIRTATGDSPVVTVWSDGRIELRAADGKVIHADATDVPAPQEVSGAWKLSFPPHWGAPPSVTLDKLISWTDDTNDGVRYFSGTATYEKEIEIPAERLVAGRELWLDLGVVKDFAEVSLNGHDFSVLWKPPFRVNITRAAKPGANHLIVKVTNLWPNRLIGDEQLPPDCEWDGDRLKAWPKWLLAGKPSPTGRFTFATWHHYTKDSPLLKSGLLGPVALRTAEMIPAD